MATPKRLAGKRALVTGAGTGIGRAVALEFADEGGTVVLHYSHSSRGAREAVEDIRRAGGKAEAFAADFNDIRQIQRLAKEAREFLGGLDVLVNNAGITMNRRFEDVTVEQFDILYRVNVRAQFFLTQALLSALQESRGVIINLTSIHAFEGFPEHAVYAGTKGAIVAYTRELAIELAPRGIRVNGLAPGAVPVESHVQAIPNFDPAALGRLIPAGFAGAPRDIARAAVFLASDDARYVVGQTLVVDGGTTAWMPFGEGFRRPLGDLHFGRGYVPDV